MVCPRAQHRGDAQEIVAERFICRMKGGKRKELQEGGSCAQCQKQQRLQKDKDQSVCWVLHMETTGDVGRAVHVEAGAPCSKPIASSLAPLTPPSGRSRPERAASVKDENPRVGSFRLGKNGKEGERKETKRE